MASTLPNELLVSIFTQLVIARADLLQLALTCKQWSLVAQKELYKEIRLNEDSLGHNRDEFATRLGQLIQTLRTSDIKCGEFVETIYVDFESFKTINPNGSNYQHLLYSAVIIATLTPNVAALRGDNLTTAFHDALSSLRSNGFLQKVAYIKETRYVVESGHESLISSYNLVVTQFRDTIKEIKIIDGVGRTVSTQHTIQPDHLQRFQCLESLQFHEFRRCHLARMSAYLSHCSSRVKAIDIHMNCYWRGYTFTPPLLDEFDENSAITPIAQLKRLHIKMKDGQLTTNEMKYIMHMFPSLEEFSFSVQNEYTAPIQQDMEVVLRFFAYLSQIPHVKYQSMWCGASEGLGLLPHWTMSFGVKELHIDSAVRTQQSGLLISLVRTKMPVKLSNGTSAIIRIIFNGSQAGPQSSLMNSAIEGIQGESIEKITIGPKSYDSITIRQKIQQHSIDYMMGTYTSIQELTFSNVEFPSQASHSRIQTRRQLRYLHLDRCKITEDNYTMLSQQYERINCLEITFSQWSDYYRVDSNADRKIRAHLPYTAVDTISLQLMPMKPCVIKLWTNSVYTTLKATLPEGTKEFKLEECHDIHISSTNGYEVIVHCVDLKIFRFGEASFKLP